MPDEQGLANNEQIVVIPPEEGETRNEIAKIVNEHKAFSKISELSNLKETQRIDIMRLGVVERDFLGEFAPRFEAVTGFKFAPMYKKVTGVSASKPAVSVQELRNDDLETRRSLKGSGAVQMVIIATRGLYQTMKRKLFGGSKYV